MRDMRWNREGTLDGAEEGLQLLGVIRLLLLYIYIYIYIFIYLINYLFMIWGESEALSFKEVICSVASKPYSKEGAYEGCCVGALLGSLVGSYKMAVWCPRLVNRLCESLV